MVKILFILTIMILTGLTGVIRGQESNNSVYETVPLKITVQPKANYTDIARQHQVKGWVRLEVTFLATGEIGDVIYVAESSKKKKKLTKYGLVALSIEAAKEIKFEPARKNGEPISVTRIVEYHFTIY